MTRRDIVFLSFLVIGTAVGFRVFFADPARRADQTATGAAPADPSFTDSVNRANAALRAAWEEKKLAPVARTDEFTFARRLSLALTGSIPSLEDIRLIESWPQDQRQALWTHHLLRDRRFADYLAERLARVWVGIDDGPFLIFRRHRFVTWLSDQLHSGQPYDQLVRTLITAEGIWTTQPAVNFLTAAILPDTKGPDPAKVIGRLSRACLGIRLDCVQCHDDMLGNGWTQKNFHELAAFFSGAELSLTGLRDQPPDYRFKFHKAETEVSVTPAVPFHSESLPDEGSARSRLSRWLTHPDNPAFSRAVVNRFWAIVYGQPLIDPVDDLPVNGPFPVPMEILADDFRKSGYDLRRLVKQIAFTEPFRLESLGTPENPITLQHERCWAAFPLSRLRPEQMAGSILQAASLNSLDADTHILMRLARYDQQKDFLRRFGDRGEDEFIDSGGTIPQRLLMMNGRMVHEQTKENMVANSATRIGALARDAAHAVDLLYWCTLTRSPTAPEKKHFTGQLASAWDSNRNQAMEDLLWVLINSTEFSWNH